MEEETSLSMPPQRHRPQMLLGSDADLSEEGQEETLVVDQQVEAQDDEDDDEEEEEEDEDVAGDEDTYAVPIDSPDAPQTYSQLRAAGQEEALVPVADSFVRNAQADSTMYTTGGTRKVPKTLQKVLVGEPGQPPLMKPSDVKSAPRSVLVEAFREIDYRYNGYILVDDLVEALQACGLKANHEAAVRILSELDTNLDGRVTVEEFIDFVRHLEDMQRFTLQRKAQGHFLVVCKYFCFVFNTVLLCFLVLVLVRIGDSNINPELLGLLTTAMWISAVLMVFLLAVMVVRPMCKIACKKTTAEVLQVLRKKRPPPPPPKFGDRSVKQYDPSAYSEARQQMQEAVTKKSWSPLEVKDAELSRDQKKLLQAGELLPGAVPASNIALEDLKNNTLPVDDHFVSRRTMLRALEDNQRWR
mmetsp:Transcript_5421/g.11999  ORF Transcript_5421/g.11999 Transcript_5421/m.11999 type:complete len:414 (-) Transcript_5421:21-1262(-)